jgi:Transposase DDE domain group 1
VQTKKPAPLGELPIEISSEPAPELLTALGGLPLVAQTFRALKLPESIGRNVHIKQRERGFSEAQAILSLILLHVVGGEHVDDLRRLHADPGLAAMLGHDIPSPEAMRTFLKRFHDDQAVETAKAARKPGQIAFIPEETAPLQGLSRVNDDLLQEMGRRAPNQRIATVDQDATLQYSRKKQAQPTYDGERGYQPMIAIWAEMDLVLSDEFRDGNVPAGMDPLTVAKRAFQALPKTVTEYYYRADSASYEHNLLGWLQDEQRPDGPQGRIGFAISADMTKELRAALQSLPESAWTGYQAPGEPLDEFRDWAEVPFVPSQKSERKEQKPLRYVGIRIRPRQGELFADGSEVKYFAVVSNRWELGGARLLQWHRQKAGTIEPLHDVVKNELGGGVLPSKWFGANAAWMRITLLAHNVLVALKWIALPPEFLRARPKRLRFELFVQAGRLVSHARKLMLRLAAPAAWLQRYLEAWNLLLAPS